MIFIIISFTILFISMGINLYFNYKRYNETQDRDWRLK